jgi:malonate decarboxylase beta subunit
VNCLESRPSSWYEATARQRIDAFVDPGTFQEFIGPEQRETSPHVSLFDLPEQFDDGIAVGRARLGGNPLLLAAQEGRFMGGAIGEVHGAKLTGLLRSARKISLPVMILFDTGGVRLQEANAGEIAVAEIMREVILARVQGIPVVGLIGGRSGCFGGGALIAGCCSCLVISEQGRISVSGPEVIETHRGVEEFDSKDRALVWRVSGGKHRYLIGGADIYVDDSAQAFRRAALEAASRPATLDLDVLCREQQRLNRRLQRFGAMREARHIWASLGLAHPETISAQATEAFIADARATRECSDDAR